MVNQHAFDTTPDTTRLEIAQEALGCLIALRSQLISVERGKSDPNAESISELKNQRNVLFGLLRSLSCDDQLISKISSQPMDRAQKHCSRLLT